MLRIEQDDSGKMLAYREGRLRHRVGSLTRRRVSLDAAGVSLAEPADAERLSRWNLSDAERLAPTAQLLAARTFELMRSQVFKSVL